MMANLQYELYQLVSEFMKGVANPRAELPYTYLMAWFVFHYPMLMEPPKTTDVPFVRWLEELNWTNDYLFNIRRILLNIHAYEVFCCLASFPSAELGEAYEDVSSADDERLIALSLGLFLWLMNICPRYMVLIIDKGIIVEPYMPSCFTVNQATFNCMSVTQTQGYSVAGVSWMWLRPDTTT